MCKSASVPCALGAALANGNPAAGRALLVDRLSRFYAWLNDRLEQPVAVTERNCIRFFSVFGAVGYLFGLQSRTFTSMRRGVGRWEKVPGNVELLKPLSGPAFLQPCLEQAGISEQIPQASLFHTPDLARQHDEWLCRAAYRLLREAPRFRALRRSWLPQAFALDPDARRIALRSGAHRPDIAILSDTYMMVWQDLPRLLRVERENPQLLPLVMAAMKRGVVRRGADPVQALKRRLLSEGVSEAGWRYLTRHGSRLFRCAWARRGTQTQLDMAVQVLRKLQAAGLPPPLPRSLQQEWFGITAHWIEVPSELIAAAAMQCAQGDAKPALPLSGGPRIVPEIFARIARWAVETGLEMDRHQCRQGWPWLERRYRRWQRGEGVDPAAEYREWPMLPAPLRVRGIVAVPLRTSRELREEGWAMHNCVGRAAGPCMAGRERYFSLRDGESGRRVATMVLKNDGNGGWTPGDVLRSYNRPAPTHVRRAAVRVAEEYAKRALAFPLPLGEGLGVREGSVLREVSGVSEVFADTEPPDMTPAVPAPVTFFAHPKKVTKERVPDSPPRYRRVPLRFSSVPALAERANSG